MARSCPRTRPAALATRIATLLLLFCVTSAADARRLTPVVFVSYAGGQSDIWVMQGDGSNPVNLTNDKAEDDFAEWSPDGRRIVWTRGGRGPEGEIWVMNADGSGKQQLTFDTYADFNATWSPEGSEIAWRSRRNNNSDIHVMKPDGTYLRQLTNDPASDFAPDWSPDGSRIAFTSTRSGASAIYTMAADGSDVRKLTPDFMEAALPGWSPDGSRIVFGDGFCATCGESDLFVMNADGSGLTQVTDTPENELAKAWTLDGASVVGDHAKLNPAVTHLFKGDVGMWNVATGALTKLTDTPGIEEGHADCSQSGRTRAAATAATVPAPEMHARPATAAAFESRARLRPGGSGVTIEYALPSAGPVRVTLFDVAGREVGRPVDGWQAAGPHEVAFATGRSRQVYLYRVDWSGRWVTGKVVAAP